MYINSFITIYLLTKIFNNFLPVGAADSALCGADQHSGAVRPVVLLGVDGLLDRADGLLPVAQGP